MNLKRLVSVWALSFLLPSQACSQDRVATVNMERIFDHYWKTARVDAALNNWIKEINEAERPMFDAWQQAQEDYQQLLDKADDPALSTKERAARQQAIEDQLAAANEKENSLEEFERTARASLAIKKDRMRKDLLADITVAIDHQAKADGYSWVLDSSAQTPVPNLDYSISAPEVLYANPTNDITQSVLAQLNAGAPVEVSKNVGDASGSENETPPE